MMKWLFVALVIALVTYSAATLGRVPAWLNDDDGSYASAAFQFWRTGRPGVPGYKDAIGLSRDAWPYGRIAAAFQGMFFPIFGVSVRSGLAPSFLAGLGLLALTAALGARLWDRPTGLLAAVLLAASGKFFEASRWARPDILLACFFLLSLWLAASAPPDRPSARLILSGLVAGLAGDVHLNGFLIAPLPLLFWIFLPDSRPPHRWRPALLFVGSAAIGPAYWLALHYWPNPQAMLHQASVLGGSTHGVRILRAGPIEAARIEIGRYVEWFWAARGHRHLFEGLCVLASGVWLAWRGKGRDRAVVLIWVVFFLIAACLMSNPFGWYLILVWPLFALWMARAFLSFPGRRLAGAACLILFAAYVANLGLWHFKALQDVPLQERIPELRRLAPAGAPVIANGALWFAFWDRDYTDDLYLKFRQIEARLYPETGPTGWEAEQRKHGWRYIVAYGDLQKFLDPEVPLEEIVSAPVYSDRIELARDTRAFSLARCTIERRIPGAAYTILVLRINEGVSPEQRNR